MANLLDDALDYLAEALQEHASVEVTYRRGPDSLTIKVTPGSSLLKITDPNGSVRMVRTDADFIFAADQLDFGDGVFEPRTGDLLDRTWSDEVTRRYEVCSPGGKEPSWRYSGQSRVLVRVHTKFRGVVT